MRLNTHDRTPRPQNSKFFNVLLTFCASLFFIICGLGALMCVFYAKSYLGGLLIFSIPILLTAFCWIQIKDIENSYVEINGEAIHVVDYYWGVKKEKDFLFSDITSAEIVSGYSHQIKGYRLNKSGISYIVFKNKKQYLFKIICLPETQELFKKIIPSLEMSL